MCFITRLRLSCNICNNLLSYYTIIIIINITLTYYTITILLLPYYTIAIIILLYYTSHTMNGDSITVCHYMATGRGGYCGRWGVHARPISKRGRVKI